MSTAINAQPPRKAHTRPQNQLSYLHHKLTVDRGVHWCKTTRHHLDNHENRCGHDDKPICHSVSFPDRNVNIKLLEE